MNRVLIFGLSAVLLVSTAAISAQSGTTLPGTTLPGTTLPGTTLPGTESRSGCGGCGQIPAQSAAPKKGNVVVVGVLTNEGVECQALRADDGTLYTLTGDLKKFQVGDRVRVEGQVAEFSFCQQGITLGVNRIKKAS